MKIGRKIYYDNRTGIVVVNTGERIEERETTEEEDFAGFVELAERTKETIGVIKLEYGQYGEEFNSHNGYKINLDTLKIEFSYPDPSEPEKPPVFKKPLTEQLKELETKMDEKDRENKNALFEIYNMLGGE